MTTKLILILGGGALLYFWWESQQSADASVVPAGTPTTGTSTTGTTTTSTPVQPSGPSSLANIYAALLAAAPTDNNFTQIANDWQGTPYHWGYYLAQALPAGISAPDPTVVFPGTDMTQPMNLSYYWATMSNYLTSHFGLSGFRGMGALNWSARFAA